MVPTFFLTNGTSTHLNSLPSSISSTPRPSKPLDPNIASGKGPDSHSPRRPLENFDDIASVLTLSSPSRLNLPDIYAIAKESLSSFFPHTPTPYYEFGQSEEALVLAIEHDVKPVSGETLTINGVLLYCYLPLRTL
jgi:hypothetical protein